MKLKFIFLGGLLTSAPVLSFAQQHSSQMNVLFLTADDLRPELGCYGVKEVKTPNIDRLAHNATLFQNAYCNVPVSGASRASMLTGVYPRYPNRFIAFDASASKDAPQAIPISRWFTDHGYTTISNGKVFHQITDHADSWSEYPWRVHPDGYGSDWAVYNKWELWMNTLSGRTINPKSMRGPFCEAADVSDYAYDDGKATQRTISDLRRLKDSGKPFFLACGFWRPHLPFNAPKKYWDLYQREDLPLADNQYRPKNLPPQVQGSGEILSYARIENTTDTAFQQEAKHGYYASVSYIDALIGEITNELDQLGLSKNTIVVLLGDHGWHLGEHTFWGKHNLMDKSTHVPLIVSVPNQKGATTTSIVELVDLYPTLCQLCNLPTPTNQLDGVSFVPILKNPKKTTKKQVYIQWTGGDNAVTPRYNYAQWNKKSTARMLFDHKTDKQENTNIVGDKKYNKTIIELSTFINEKKKLINK